MRSAAFATPALPASRGERACTEPRPTARCATGAGAGRTGLGRGGNRAARERGIASARRGGSASCRASRRGAGDRCGGSPHQRGKCPASSRRGLCRGAPAAACEAATTGLIARRRPGDHGPASAVAGAGGSRRDRRAGQGSLAARCDFAGDPSADGAPVSRTRPRAKTSAGGARRARRTRRRAATISRSGGSASPSSNNAASNRRSQAAGRRWAAATSRWPRARASRSCAVNKRTASRSAAWRTNSRAKTQRRPARSIRKALPASPLRLSTAGGRAGYRGSRRGQR